MSKVLFLLFLLSVLQMETSFATKTAGKFVRFSLDEQRRLATIVKATSGLKTYLFDSSHHFDNATEVVVAGIRCKKVGKDMAVLSVAAQRVRLGHPTPSSTLPSQKKISIELVSRPAI